jgi:hypothetical protein
MTGLHYAAWLAVVSACFHPSYDHPACGPNGECPSGLTCSARLICEGRSGEQIDGGIDGVVDIGATADARVCFGTGLLQLCLTSPPSQAVTLPGGANPLDTGVNANCTQIVSQASGPDLCVIAGTSVTVAGSLVAVGARPLVLIGADAVTVASGGAVDVSSRANPRRTGAGTNTGTCTTTGINGKNDAGGGGGGAGGSFGTAGGKGGTGDLNMNDLPAGTAAGGTPGPAQATPMVLRGGCSGGAGGDGNNTAATQTGGAGGDGGGAVYLIAGTMITIDGDVFASGAGGRVASNIAGSEQGAGGGGSGGMIGLDAPTIQVQGHVVANGGAGAGGGAQVGGTNGGDGTTTQWNKRASAGQGDPASSGPGGDGAQGTAIGMTTNLDGGAGDGAGGGGAGGLGLVWIYGNTPGTTMISPAPTRF